MAQNFVTVKEWLQSVLDYQSYSKNKLGIRFWTTLHIGPMLQSVANCQYRLVTSSVRATV